MSQQKSSLNENESNLQEGNYFQEIQAINILQNDQENIDLKNICQQEQNIPENLFIQKEYTSQQSYTLNKEEAHQSSQIEQNINYSKQLSLLSQICDQQAINRLDKTKNTKPSEDFQKHRNEIESKLSEKNYQLCQKIDQGGEGEIYEGYQNVKELIFQENENQEQNSFKILKQEQCIFKIYYNEKEQYIENQIKIMRSFEKNTNFVQYKESVLGEHFHILVLQKCQYSLQKELELINHKKEKFSKDQILFIIFDLLDGLIQLRIYNILHLDIKPANILKTLEGDYVFTDFGLSSKYEKLKKVIARGYSEQYASKEQLDKYGQVTFKSDVYSLGETFKRIINAYELANVKGQEQNDENLKSFIKSINEIIENFMIKEDEKQREDCLSIHKKLFKLIRSIEYQPFLEKYQSKIQRFVSSMYQFDQNKDIPHFQETLLYYLKRQLQIENLIQKDIKYILYLRQQIASCYQDIGRITKAKDYLLESLEIANSDLKQIQEQIANIHEDIGYAYKSFGETEKSLEHSFKSLEIRKLLFQDNHSSIADSLERIGMCYLYKYEELNIEYQAKQYFNIFQFLLVDEDDTTPYQNNQKYLKKAEKYLFESYKIRNLSPKETLDKLISQHNIGYMYMRSFQPQKALVYFNNIFGIYKKIYQGHNPSISFCLQNIGLCHLMLYKKKEAIDNFKQSIEIEKNLYKDHIHFKLKSLLIEIVSNLYEQNKNNIFSQITEFFSYINEYSQKNETGGKQLLQSLQNLSSFFMANLFNPQPIIDEKFYNEYNKDIQQVARFIFQFL